MTASVSQAVGGQGVTLSCSTDMPWRRTSGAGVSSGGVRGVWSRHELLTRHQRLLRLEKTVAERKIDLSDDQIRFAINLASTRQSGLKMSSQLLKLGKIVRSGDRQ